MQPVARRQSVGFLAPKVDWTRTMHVFYAFDACYPSTDMESRNLKEMHRSHAPTLPLATITLSMPPTLTK